VRAWPTDQPTPTLTTTPSRALLVPSGGTWRDDAAPVEQPMRTRTTRETDALVVPVEGRDGLRARTMGEPLRTQTARLTDALVVPYYGGTAAAQPASQPLPTVTTVDGAGLAFLAALRGGGDKLRTRPVDVPLSAITAGGQHHLLIRHNTARGNPAQMCTPIDEPARTLTTAGHQSLLGWADPPAVQDCTFRMLQPDEIQAAMAFQSSYTVLGNRREQVRQLGNAVTPPAAEWLIAAIAASLHGGAA